METEMLKNIFVEVKNKFETAIGILKSEKITIDPEDPAAVAHYAKVMKTVREKWASAFPLLFCHTILLNTYLVVTRNLWSSLFNCFDYVILQSIVHSTGQTCCQSPRIS